MKLAVPVLLLLILVSFPLTTSAQIPRTVMVEEFTGTWCQWCPYGHDSLQTILARYPNSRALCYHNQDAMATTEGNMVDDSLAVTSYPSAAIDRIVWNVGGTYQFWLSRTLWDQAMRTRLTNAPTSPIAFTVTGTYDTASRAISGNVLINVSAAMTGNYYIHIVLSEDSLNYTQKKNVNSVVIDVSPYWHKYVVRKLITGALGIQLSGTGFTANQQINYPFQYTHPSTWNYKKLRLSVFIDNKFGMQFGHRNIEQGYQEKLSTALVFTPVQLVSFQAAPSTDGVLLTWRTTAENSNRGWTIERRDVEGDWQDIGFVDGAGTTQESQSYDYTDRGATRGSVYDYRLHQVDFDGTTSYSPVARVAFFEVPVTTELHQNYPNPFNPSTDITVQLSESQNIRLEIYDAIGRLINTLANGDFPAGYHAFTWSGNDASGLAVPAGTYFYRLHTPASIQIKQMQLIK